MVSLNCIRVSWFIIGFAVCFDCVVFFYLYDCYRSCVKYIDRKCETRYDTECGTSNKNSNTDQTQESNSDKCVSV